MYERRDGDGDGDGDGMSIEQVVIVLILDEMPWRKTVGGWSAGLGLV
jgi:hypothetical protein